MKVMLLQWKLTSGNKLKVMEDIFDNIESRLDIIEEFVDELEDNDVDVDSLRHAIGQVWSALDDIR